MFGSLLGIFMSLAFAVSTTTDPFADLSPGEIKETIRIIRDSKKLSPDIRFPVIRRQEPPKKDWLGHRTANFRQAYAAVFDYQKSLMTEVIVDLNSGKLVSTKDLPGIKPPVLVEEYERARKLVRIDLRWQKAMRDRGVQNLEDVWIDIWAPGLIRPEEKAPGQRLLRCLSYMKGKGKNFYSRPIEGVVVTVDLSQNKVTSVWDMEKAPIASGIREIEGKSGADLLKPLTVIQKKGSSVQMSGQDVTWYRWKFHWSMDPMQGLQLHHVRFDDKGVERTILYKISLAEMFVPYGAPEKSWSFRNAFDVGEYGVGKTLHPLEKGKDVPDNAILLDVHVPDDIGKDVLTIPGAALFERDMGVSWKHRDSETGEQSSDQARQLVATFMTTVGNYDYGVTYIFHMDGTLQVEAQLTGIMLAKGTELVENSCLKSCQPLAEKNILAPFHQHFFNFRMDFDVDGINNNAVEMNVKAVPMGKA
ncbi:MAG: tyramine oxidase, partial [Pseudobdellovibrionaceae bacterium]